LELLPLVTFGGPANMEEIILGFLLFFVGCGGTEETSACGLAVSLHMVCFHLWICRETWI
jgi:hypothetical protein